MFFQVSASVKSANILLARASHVANPRLRVGGDHNITRRRASINGGHQCNQCTTPSIFSILPRFFFTFEVCEELRITKMLTILSLIYGSQQWSLDPERALDRVCYICTYLPADFL